MGGPRQGYPEKDMTQQLQAIIAGAKTDAALKGSIDHLKVTNTPEGTLIELVDGEDNFLFPVGSSGLKPQAVKLLEQLAPIFARMRNKLEIHGHTDGRPFEGGSKKSNWALSFERANEARRVLEAAGVPPGRVSGVQAHADTQPLNRKDPLAPENRRLALLILKDKTKRSKKPRPAEDTGAAAAQPEQPQQAQPDTHAPTPHGEP
jgi:chemotaxis protein MotB